MNASTEASVRTELLARAWSFAKAGYTEPADALEKAAVALLLESRACDWLLRTMLAEELGLLPSDHSHLVSHVRQKLRDLAEQREDAITLECHRFAGVILRRVLRDWPLGKRHIELRAWELEKIASGFVEDESAETQPADATPDAQGWPALFGGIARFDDADRECAPCGCSVLDACDSLAFDDGASGAGVATLDLHCHGCGERLVGVETQPDEGWRFANGEGETQQDASDPSWTDAQVDSVAHQFIHQWGPALASIHTNPLRLVKVHIRDGLRLAGCGERLVSVDAPPRWPTDDAGPSKSEIMSALTAVRAKRDTLVGAVADCQSLLKNLADVSESNRQASPLVADAIRLHARLLGHALTAASDQGK